MPMLREKNSSRTIHLQVRWIVCDNKNKWNQMCEKENLAASS